MKNKTKKKNLFRNLWDWDYPRRKEMRWVGIDPRMLEWRNEEMKRKRRKELCSSSSSSSPELLSVCLVCFLLWFALICFALLCRERARFVGKNKHKENNKKFGVDGNRNIIPRIYKLRPWHSHPRIDSKCVFLFHCLFLSKPFTACVHCLPCPVLSCVWSGQTSFRLTFVLSWK